MTALSIPDFKILLKTTTVGMVILRATKTGEENYVIISNNCLRLGSHEAEGSKGEHS